MPRRSKNSYRYMLKNHLTKPFTKKVLASILFWPDGSTVKHKINWGTIASNFTSELTAMQKALQKYYSLDHTKKINVFVIFCNSKTALEIIKSSFLDLHKRFTINWQKINSLKSASCSLCHHTLVHLVMRQKCRLLKKQGMKTNTEKNL